MVEQTVIIGSRAGLHMRPSGEISRVANLCTSCIKIIFEDLEINAKSVLNIMSAGIQHEDEVLVQCIGNDEVEDLRKIVSTIEKL